MRIVFAYLISGIISASALSFFLAFLAMGTSTSISPTPAGYFATFVLLFTIINIVITPLGVFAVKLISRDFNQTTGKNYSWGLSIALISLMIVYHFYAANETNALEQHGLFVYAKAALIFMLSAALGGIIFDRVANPNHHLSNER